MSLNQSYDSEAPYNDLSYGVDSSNASYHEDTRDDDSINDELEHELLDDNTPEDFALVMNESSIESHQARLALALMLLTMADGEDTCKHRYHDYPSTSLMTA